MFVLSPKMAAISACFILWTRYLPFPIAQLQDGDQQLVTTNHFLQGPVPKDPFYLVLINSQVLIQRAPDISSCRSSNSSNDVTIL